MAEVQAKLVTNQHAVGKKPRALKRKAVNALCCYLFLRLRRLHLTGVMRCTLCSALQCSGKSSQRLILSYLILNPSTDHALSAAHCSRKNLMFIGASNKLRLLLPSDSLLIRCACVLIGDASVHAHSPYLERFFRGCCSYLPSPIDTAGKAILLRVVVRL